LKYGVTLDKEKTGPTISTANFDYKLSDNTDVWQGTTSTRHKAYHHNVAAIVRDDVAGLNNMQSHSTDEGSVVTMGIGTRLGENPALTGLNTDKEVIIWGNNGLTGEKPDDLCGDLSHRTNRIWMVDNLTQQDYKVRIGAGNPQSDIFPYGGPNYQVYLLLSKTTNFSEGTAQNIPGEYNSATGLHEFSCTFDYGQTYYFTFSGWAKPGVGCQGCGYAGQKNLRFTSANWQRGAKSGSYSLGDDFSVAVDVSSELGNAGFATGYPRASSGNTLRLRRKNSASDVEKDMTARLSFTTASLPAFKIYSIGRSSNVNDEIEVYGMCSGARVIPRLSYAAKASGSSYTIYNNENVIANKSSAYTSNRGTMQVIFDIPVKEVYVVYKRGARSGEIGIGPLTFRCPPPAPTINSDGLGFTKDGPAELELCENVQYVFRIVNTNCDPIKVNFTDTLPAGMKWIAESLIIDDSNIGSSSIIHDYDGTGILKIDSIVISPGTHTFMATAEFDDNATAGTYSNRARIGYNKIVTGVKTPVYTYSCDAYKGCDYYTSVLATGTNTRYKSLEVMEYESSKEFYKEKDTITVSMKFNNPSPNPAFSGSFKLNFIYNEEFKYIKNSFSSSGMTVSPPAPQFEVEDNDTIQGYIYFNVTNIPEGESTISLSFKAPDNTAADESGMAESFVIGFDMETESEDVCEIAVFDEFYDDIEVPFIGCSSISGNPITWGASSYDICEGRNLVLSVSTELECLFGNNVTYRLEFKQNVSDHYWTTIFQKDTVIVCENNITLSRTFGINSATVDNTGMYRILISAAGRIDMVDCRVVSDTTTVTVTPAVNASMITIEGTTTICSGTKPTLTASVSGVSGTVIYKWYKSQTETAPFHEGASYTPTQALTKDTVFYVSALGDDYCESVTGGRKEVEITIAAKLSGGKIDTVQTIISGQTPAELTSTTDASGGSGTFIYQWEQNTNGTQWNPVTGAESSTYQPAGALTTPIQYRREASNDCGRAYSDTVTIVPVKPLALKYIACQGASVTMGFDATNGVTYYWYDDKTDGNLIRLTASDTIIRVKDNIGTQTFWAEPRYRGVSLPRYKVELELSANCGTTTPTDCAATGTILFKEDFGGNSESDPPYKPPYAPGKGIPQMDPIYKYDIALVEDNQNAPYLDEEDYMIAKIGEPHTSSGLTWDTIYDHTYPLTGSRGYFLEVNASIEKGQFYEHTINDLCEGTTLYFSAWINNVLKYPGYEHHVNQIFILEDGNGVRITEYYTGDILNGHVGWKQYGFPFTVPANISTLKLRIINNGNGSSGNDFALDDIEIRFCAPPVTITLPEKTDTTICLGSSFTFAGEYTDDNTFGSALVYRWEKNTGDINNPDDWKKIDDTQNISNNGTVNSTYTIYPVVSTDEGYYRLVVANDENIDNYGCRAMSDIVHVRVSPVCAVTDHATTSCSGTALVIPVLNNDIYDRDTCTTLVVKVVIDPKPENGTCMANANNEIEYTGNQSGRDSLAYTITCNGFTSAPAWVYITVNTHSSAFVDDVWYFGENSQGIRFVNDGSGVYTATDASGESQVRTHENSLVVSSPYCNGQNIFYSSHNQIYNSLHQPMLHGHFMGNQSVADGLAACYIGANKYLFFSVTSDYEDLADPPHTPMGLKAYVVDMNADHGRGDIVDSVEIETHYMSESIELIAGNAANIYWLVYAYHTGNNYELHVRKIDISQPLNSGMIGSVLTHSVQQTSSTQHPYTLKASPQHDQIAIANGDGKTVDVFKFNNTTGELSSPRTTSHAQHPISGLAYGVEFSPDGNQLYAAGYSTAGGDPMLYQFTISESALTYVSSIKYWTGSGHVSYGGGLKLGPDGKIYVMRCYSSFVGTVSDPNENTPLSDRYQIDGMDLKVTVDSYDLQFSTGITKPSIMDCNTNNAPVTQPDHTSLCVSSTSRTVKVNVIANDYDDDPLDTIFLTGARFADPSSDEALADIAFNAADSTVTLTVKQGADIGVAGHIFEINYDVKDNGLPASQCATGTLTVQAYPAPTYPDIRIRICPDAGSVKLSKYLDTANGVKTNSIHWTSQIPGISIASPSGEVSSSNLKSARVYTFSYTLEDLCGTSPKRKLYLEKLTPDKMHPLKDTVVMCYKYAEAVQINQLFGIEANGSWEYYSSAAHDVDQYVSESTSPAYDGAVVMNGKALYEQAVHDSNFDSYHGNNEVKMVTFIYKADDGSCLHGNEYRVVVVLTENVMN
jgi:hypothetical protein